ncbi:hypothetical protein [Streptomyces sp. NPDC048442]|uniref:hypothetical protein n=1 Tax=Streptomyces sp. NPDC048442 TaxID=3154823 RepID=UPI003445F3C0
MVVKLGVSLRPAMVHVAYCTGQLVPARRLGVQLNERQKVVPACLAWGGQRPDAAGFVLRWSDKGEVRAHKGAVFGLGLA